MTPEQHLYAKLAEEATEVAHIALKVVQFGPHDVYGGETNLQRLHTELHDLWAMVDELNARFQFHYSVDVMAMARKQAKVRHFADYSVKLGYLREAPLDVDTHL